MEQYFFQLYVSKHVGNISIFGIPVHARVIHFRDTRIPRYIQNYLILPNEIFSHLLPILLFSLFPTISCYIVSKFYKSISDEIVRFFSRDYLRYIDNE